MSWKDNHVPRVLCFGEVLWDCLPGGRVPGGAPLNVACHLQKLGAEALMISAVGADAPGDELLAHLTARGLETRFVRRDPGRPTGTVTVALNSRGEPSYVIHENVAWDEIALDAPLRSEIGKCDALVFGSLAARSAANRTALDELLRAPSLLRVLDVNLRPPFDDAAGVLHLAGRADLVKLNVHELRRLTGCVIVDAEWPHAFSAAAERLAKVTGCERICMTAGERGAGLWDGGAWFVALAPAVKVRDTIGAGDAFTAALVHGILQARERPDWPPILARACALGALVASLPGGQPEYDLAELAALQG